MNEPLLGSFQTINLNNKEVDNRNYPRFLFLIGLFYILPSLQFVFFQSKDNNLECYYNYKCYNTVGFIPAFNSVISNILYVILGIIFILIVRFNSKFYDTSINQLNLIKSPSLYYSLGISLIFEGICSATYHICPTKLNFQFDTTFMYIGGILMFITIYSKRHMEPDPMKIYCFLGFLIFINILPLSGLTTDFEQYFWGGIFIFVAYVMVSVSIYIYYDKEFNLDLQTIKHLYHNFKNFDKKHTPKLILITILNLFTLGTYLWAVITQANFTDWVLGLIIVNMIIYFIYYVIQKIRYKEPISLLIAFWLLIDIIVIGLSLVFYLMTSTNIFLTPEESKEMNKPCIIFNYFDYHDVWHILSALGLFIFMNIVFFLDNKTSDMIYIHEHKF